MRCSVLFWRVCVCFFKSGSFWDEEKLFETTGYGSFARSLA